MSGIAGGVVCPERAEEKFLRYCPLPLLGALDQLDIADLDDQSLRHVVRIDDWPDAAAPSRCLAGGSLESHIAEGAAVSPCVVQQGREVGRRRPPSIVAPVADPDLSGRLQMAKERVRVEDGVCAAIDHGERDGREREVSADRRIDDQRLHALARALDHVSPARSFGDPRRGSSRLGTPVVMPW